MNRPDLIDHLRTTHHLDVYEPGGGHHEPEAVGYPQPFDSYSTNALDEIHDGDHEDGQYGDGDHDHPEGDNR